MQSHCTVDLCLNNAFRFMDGMTRLLSHKTGTPVWGTGVLGDSFRPWFGMEFWGPQNAGG
jgi:hypothetical protein